MLGYVLAGCKLTDWGWGSLSIASSPGWRRDGPDPFKNLSSGSVFQPVCCFVFMKVRVTTLTPTMVAMVTALDLKKKVILLPENVVRKCFCEIILHILKCDFSLLELLGEYFFFFKAIEQNKDQVYKCEPQMCCWANARLCVRKPSNLCFLVSVAYLLS